MFGKKCMVIVALLVGQVVCGTELEIVNMSGDIIDVVPVLALHGKRSFGKAVFNIANNLPVKYNSGIYTIIGLQVTLKKAFEEYGRMFEHRASGYINNWPAISVMNRNAKFVLGRGYIGYVYPNKNNQQNELVTLTIEKREDVKRDTSGGDFVLIE